MHGKRMVVLAGLALAFWSALIGPRAVTAAPANTQAAASAPVAAPPPASQPASAATDFDGRLREVEAAEADTDFAKAVRLCQAMITDFKTGDQLKTLGEALRRLTDGKKTASKLAFAVQKLAASDVQVRQAGAQVLEDEGDLGGIFLRHAFRTKEEPIAREAGRILAKMGDTSSIPLFLDKLMADPRSPLAEVASQGLVLMVHTMDKSVVASCFGLVQSDKGFVMARVVDVLEAVFLREVKRDEKAFNEAAGHPDAANVLRDYFSAALLSTNPAVAGWACERVLDMLPMRDGFRVRYYPNTEFKGVAVDRLESAVRLDLDRSLRTGGRSNDLSVRWTSDVLVRQAGDHTVGLQASRDLPRTVRLWVDDKQVLEMSPGVQDAAATVTLETGWHKLRIDYVKQAGGINAGDISFTWAGPKVEGAQVAQVAQSQAVAFMHGPWPEELAAMAKAATDLGAKNYPVVKAARQRLAAAASLGRVFLFNVIGKQAGAARRQATDGLCDQVRQIESRRFPVLYNLALAADAEPVNPSIAILCAALWQNCNSDPEPFNALVGAPDGYAKLKAHVEAALVSNDKALVARACRDGSPFSPALSGLYGRYFADADFRELATERLDVKVEVVKPQYPLPPDRQGRVSAEWSGWLVVEKTTTNTFWPTTGGQSGFSVDGIGVGWGTAMRLAPGRHACRGEFWQGDTNAASGIGFAWDVPGAGRRPVGPFNCAPWDSRLDALGRSAADLASGDTMRIRNAREVLRDSAGVGLLHLRNAIRYGAAPEAAAAAIFLGGTQDKDAAPVLLARLKQEKDAAVIMALTDAIGALAGVIAPKVFPELYKEALAEGAGEMNPYASILCAALWRVCGSDATKFGALVGEPGGYAKLDAHVKAAQASKDQAAMARACRNGYPLAPLMMGLRGRYYNETNVVDLGAERLDLQINVGNRQFPLPTNRQDNISAEWSGFLVIDKSGDYAFASDARGSAAFFVDEIPVSGKMALTNGVHTFRGSFVQNQPGGESRVSLAWSGPGIQGQQPVSGALRCAPWDGKLAELGQAMTALTSSNLMQARAARTLLAEAGEIGRTYVRNAILNAAAGTASVAASLSAEWGDTNATPVLLARLKMEKDEKAAVALADALCGLARGIESKAFPELYKAAMADGAAQMNPNASVLCGALWRVCGSDATKFGALVGDAGGYAKLEAHVKAALASKDQAALARACRNGYPLAPLMMGLRGRYYNETNVVDLGAERLDAQINVGNRLFPLPTNRQDNISADWSGILVIDKTGDYAFTSDARSWAAFFVDGIPVSVKMSLTSGVHTIRGSFVQNQPGGESRVSLVWSGPGFPAQPLAGVLRCAPWDGKLVELGKAVADLATADAAKVGGAREALTNAGEVGVVYLHNAIRHGTAPEAAAAAAFLAEYLDKSAVAPMLARFTGEKDASLSTALAGALCEMAGEIDSKALTDLYRTALAEGAAAMNPQVRILCAALFACGGSPEAFNKLVNSPNGYASLQKHVQAALTSASPETVRTACRYGAPFAPTLPGFIGRYYLGQDFRDLALEKLDPQVNVPNRQFPYPDKRQDNISARWTGLLRIEKPGDYTFIVNAHGGANVWVDDRHVAASAGWGEQKKDAVTLSPGLHKVRVDMWQASGNNQVQLQWVPPGGTRDWIPSGLLVSAPAEAVLAQVEKAVAGLSSAKPEEVGAAAEVLTRHGALSLFFLGRAVRTASPAGVAAYVPPMVAMGDLSMTNLLRDLRKTQPPLAAAMDAAIQALVAKPDRRYAPWFYAVMKADGALEFPVSGKFLSKALQVVCGNNEVRFNGEFAGGDAQGAANLKAYLGKLPKENKP